MRAHRAEMYVQLSVVIANVSVVMIHARLIFAQAALTEGGNVWKAQMIVAPVRHLLFATQTRMRMDHVLWVGLLPKEAAMHQKEQHA